MDGNVAARVVVEEFGTIGSLTASIAPSGAPVSCNCPLAGSVQRQVVVRMVGRSCLEDL